MTKKKCTIISQIITLLHVSTLSCHPLGACNQYFAKIHKYFKCSCGQYKFQKGVLNRFYESSYIIVVLILMLKYFGVICLVLHILLNQMAAFVVINFSLVSL